MPFCPLKFNADIKVPSLIGLHDKKPTSGPHRHPTDCDTVNCALFLVTQQDQITGQVTQGSCGLALQALGVRQLNANIHTLVQSIPILINEAIDKAQGREPVKPNHPTPANPQ